MFSYHLQRLPSDNHEIIEMIVEILPEDAEDGDLANPMVSWEAVHEVGGTYTQRKLVSGASCCVLRAPVASTPTHSPPRVLLWAGVFKQRDPSRLLNGGLYRKFVRHGAIQCANNRPF